MSHPLDFFSYDRGVLSTEGVPLAEIAKKVGTPFYAYSAEAFLRPLLELQKGLAPADPLVCFALKSNSNLAVLQLLGRAGAGMDLVSGGELFRALKAGIPGSRIVFSGVGKTEAEVEQALQAGILSFHAESVSELELISRVAQGRGRQAPVSLRFNPDVDARTHPYISTGLKKNKFGLRRAEVLDVVRHLDRYPGIRIDGISIHIGSQLTSLSPLDDAFSKARQLIDQIQPLLPTPLRIVDLGGGIGITYKNEKPPRLDRYCALVLKYFGPKARLSHPLRVLIEPGRTISGNAGVLVTQVLHRKSRAAKDFLIVDAAMNDLIRPALYQSYHEIIPVSQSQTKAKRRKTDVVGPVCESSDCFAHDRPLPQTLAPGDLVAILSAGAYGFSMASTYNSRPRPPEILVQNGQFHVIRERETYEDLIRGEHLL